MLNAVLIGETPPLFAKDHGLRTTDYLTILIRIPENRKPDRVFFICLSPVRLLTRGLFGADDDATHA